MNATANDQLSTLLQQAYQEHAADSLSAIRAEAFGHFHALGIPDTRNEEWKYTSLAAARKKNFSLSPAASALSLQLPFSSITANVVVMLNGRYSAAHSRIIEEDRSIRIQSMHGLLLQKDEMLTAHLGKYAPFGTEAFTAANTASFTDGLFVYLPKGKRLQHPLMVYHVSDTASGSPLLQSRLLLLLEEHSELQLVETCCVSGEGESFSNYVSESHVGASARLSYTKVQMGSAASWLVDHTRIVQEQQSVVNTQTISLGGALTRNTLHFLLNGHHTETALDGLYLVGRDSLIDNHSLVDHASPNCYSNELYKGIVGGNGQAVFNGKVMVRQDAQKTNAYQRNANILLSDEGTVNTKPQLEIFADDVKCSHGATTGQMDEEALFYLRSRGIGFESARAMLMQAFSVEVLTNIPYDELRKELQAMIAERVQAL